MPARDDEPQWFQDLSPEHQRSYREWNAAFDRIDDDDTPSLTHWEERLLGRPLFDTRQYDGGVPHFNMTRDERADWNARRERNPLSIDGWTDAYLDADRGPRIDWAGLGCGPGSDRCPYYMARWHVVFAATAASNHLGWSPSETGRVLQASKAEQSRAGIASNKADYNIISTQGKLIKSRKLLKEDAERCSELIETILDHSALKGGEFNPESLHDDKLRSLSPMQQFKHGQISAELRDQAFIFILKLLELEELSRNPQNLSKDPDGMVWLRNFTGYMCASWGRLIDGKPMSERDAESSAGFLPAAFVSLWPGKADWAYDLKWRRRIQSGRANAKHFDSELERLAPL